MKLIGTGARPTIWVRDEDVRSAMAGEGKIELFDDCGACVAVAALIPENVATVDGHFAALMQREKCEVTPKVMCWRNGKLEVMQEAMYYIDGKPVTKEQFDAAS